MALGELITLANEIEAMPLNETDKERLMVQVADLMRFKEAFPEQLRILQPFEERGVIVTAGGETVSILFCEHNCRTGEIFHISEIADQDDELPLWLVFITFGGKECCDTIAKQVEGHPMRQQSSRAYILDYSTGLLHTL